MKRVLIVAAICVIAVPAFASPGTTQLRAITGMNHASYDLATGQLAPAAGERGTTNSVWAWTGETNTFYPWATQDLNYYILDQGDIADGTTVGGFAFGYATIGLDMPQVINTEIIYWGDFDGFNNNGFYPTFGFFMTNLPTAVGSYNGWTITLDLESPPQPNDATFAISGNDIDGDGMADFGYSYFFPSQSGDTSTYTGPSIANPDLVTYATTADAEAALGAIDAWDEYEVIPNDPGPTYPPHQPNNFRARGSWYFGGYDETDPNTAPYAQFYMELFGLGGGGCPNPGTSGNFCTADIDGSGDCVVGLGDLGVLLANYGMTSGATHDMGDLEPAGGDGDIDLADLGALLDQYGDDCN